MDAAAYRLSTLRSIRRLAWIEAGVGLVALTAGLLAPALPLAAIGSVILAAGLWNLLRPSVTGMLVDGVAVVLAGVFTALVWTWLDEPRTSSAIGRWVIGGIGQIVWGVRRILGYRAVLVAADDPPAMARLAALVRELSRRDPQHDPSVVRLATRSGLRPERHRIGLFGEGAITLFASGPIRLERPRDIDVEPTGSGALGRSVKVRVRMSDLELTGEMPAEHFERFERWKQAGTRDYPIAA
jgi:hypothetical protein